MIFIFASMFFMFACTQEEGLRPADESVASQTSELTTAEAQVRFAKLLSQAASGSIEVRRFLQKEATKQFDNDYDVFYPLVKNKIVADGRSFRDILLSYTTDPKELAEIEQSQLLLNILIPDLTLFWDFNAEKWDVNDAEIVVMCRDDESDTMYENGENIGQMEKGEIPGFPCLVVKNNERMRVKSVNTRSGEATYEFASDAFDGSKRTERPVTRHWERDVPLEKTEDLSKGVSPSIFRADIVQAWEEFKGMTQAYQRDYIYYGITKENKPGNLNRAIREELFRFRVQPEAFSRIADQENKDPKLETTSERKRFLTNQEIIKRVWNDGKFELYFKTYVSSDVNGQAMEHILPFSVSAKDLFSIEKVHVHHRNSTAFRRSKNTYSVDSKNLRSKWYYPRASSYGDSYVFTLPWDLYSKSLAIHIFVEERDDDQILKEKRVVLNEFSSKMDFSLDAGTEISGVKLAAKLGYGISTTTTNTSEAEISTTVGSDKLGTLSFFYYDPVIRGERNGLYDLYSVFNGTVEATLLPRDIYRY
ncbi:hypothetical protein JN06_00768 [Bacteroides zoogleoformans]|nr:hypothetical protein [Bacteroides zoogleoformans]TWJ17455.1 hypothetical protein JN06_00768 [Bacteroides zoogleoformans]